MSNKNKKNQPHNEQNAAPRAASAAGRVAGAGQLAKAGRQRLRSVTVGPLPILNRLLARMDLENILRQHLRRDGSRTRLPTTTGLLVLLRNLLISREPIYGIGEWAQRLAPDLLGLAPEQLEHLNDDRIGRCLDRLFEGTVPELVMALVRQVVREFGVSLEELHNDSTTVSFFGAYDEAEEEGTQRGRRTPAITYGHSKDHRPDLKQLLYVLTVTEDGGVPVYFAVKSGNVVDDRTHRETWDLLVELVGSEDFLYVADCKLATTDNMRYIDRRGGRFISVLPATRKEDRQFRQRLVADPEGVSWDDLYAVRDENAQRIVDEVSVCPEETITKEKYRLWWFHSTRKARRDGRARLDHIQRAIAGLAELKDRLLGARPRLRTTEQVEPVVADLLKDTGAQPYLRVEVRQYVTEEFRQAAPGRPGKDTQYVRKTTSCCDLTWELDTEAIAAAEKTDGMFPLITNAHDMTAEEVLRAYKRQPIIEKRFSQLKTDFEVAPVYLKNVRRIQAMLCLYFFALIVQTLLERQLRQAMQAAHVASLPLYPEGRACLAPTTRRILDVFAPVQRHTLRAQGRSETFTTELTDLQRQLLKLLGISHSNYGA
jgi:transposase